MEREYCKECNYKGYQVSGDYPPFATAIFCPSCSKICPLCYGERFYKKIDNHGKSFFVSCVCQKLAKKIDLFNQIKIPSRFTTNLQKENFTEDFLQESYQKSIAFITNFQPLCKGLLFSGDIGCGKTTLVSAIAQEITLNQGYSCLFFEFSRLLEEVRSGYQSGAAESELLDRVCSTSLLIIDELGKGKNSKWEMSIIEGVVNRRYNAKQTTIFVTNFTFQNSKTTEHLKYKITDRTYSRAQEMCDFIAIEGKDLRKIPNLEGETKESVTTSKVGTQDQGEFMEA